MPIRLSESIHIVEDRNDNDYVGNNESDGDNGNDDDDDNGDYTDDDDDVENDNCDYDDDDHDDDDSPRCSPVYRALLSATISIMVTSSSPECSLR